VRQGLQLHHPGPTKRSRQHNKGVPRAHTIRGKELQDLRPRMRGIIRSSSTTSGAGLAQEQIHRDQPSAPRDRVPASSSATRRSHGCPYRLHDKHMWGVYCCLIVAMAQTWKSEQSCRSSLCPSRVRVVRARFLVSMSCALSPHQPAGECLDQSAAQCAPKAAGVVQSSRLGTGWRVYEPALLPYWQAESRQPWRHRSGPVG